MDHFGCVAAIQEKGHCEVWIYQGGAKALTSYEREWADTKEFLGKLLVDGGVPASLISPAARFFDDLESLGCETSVDHYLDGDEVIDLASRSFRVLYVPVTRHGVRSFATKEKRLPSAVIFF